MPYSNQANVTGIHFVSIVLLMLTLVFGVVAYLSVTEVQDRSAERMKMRSDLNELQASLRKLDNDHQRVLRQLGVDGDADQVVGEMQHALSEHVGQPTPADMLSGLEQMSRRLTERTAERDALLADKKTLETTVRTSGEIAGERLDVVRTARDRAQRELADVQAGHAESMSAMRKQVATVEDDLKGATAQVENLSRMNASLREQLQKAEAEYSRRIVALNERLEGMQTDEFDRADGKILTIDSGLKMVWIDLGSADYLKTGITMKVYDGSGRDQTPKGAIKVTRIDGRHQAAALIVEESDERPFLRGDFVYTPLWTPGVAESFAFVGEFDLDSDGRSDLTQLQAEVRAAGATVHGYVDAAGKRVGKKIDGRVKSLVVGSIPEEPADLPTAEQQRAAQAVLAALTEMRREALAAGVEIVSLQEFLERTGIRVRQPPGVARFREPSTAPKDVTRLKRRLGASKNGVFRAGATP